MQTLFEDGRFLPHSYQGAAWLKSRTKKRRNHQGGPDGEQLKLIQLRDHAACLLNYRNYVEAKRDLDGVTPAIDQAKELYVTPATEWLPHFAHDKDGAPWLELRPEHLDKIAGASSVLGSVGFDLFDGSAELGVPFQVTTVIRERDGVAGLIVPGSGNALEALDFLLKKRRIPRPWRPADYGGITDNQDYFRDRVALGMLGMHFGGPTIRSSQQSFLRFTREYGINTDPFLKLAEATNELIDLTFGTVGFEHDERYMPDIERINALRDDLFKLGAYLADVCYTIENNYTSQYSDGLLLFESVRYLAWLLRIPRRSSTLLDYKDLRSASDEAQRFVIQLAQVSGLAELSTPRDTAYWPPNAIVLKSKALSVDSRRPYDWE